MIEANGPFPTPPDLWATIDARIQLDVIPACPDVEPLWRDGARSFEVVIDPDNHQVLVDVHATTLDGSFHLARFDAVTLGFRVDGDGWEFAG